MVFRCLYHFFCKKKVYNIEDHKYYQLLQNIRNFSVLLTDDFEYINILPRENLLEILKIYNTHMENINTILCFSCKCENKSNI